MQKIGYKSVGLLKIKHLKNIWSDTERRRYEMKAQQGGRELFGEIEAVA